MVYFFIVLLVSMLLFKKITYFVLNKIELTFVNCGLNARTNLIKIKDKYTKNLITFSMCIQMGFKLQKKYAPI